MVVSGAVSAHGGLGLEAELVPDSGSWPVELEERAAEVGSETPDPGRALLDELVGAGLNVSVPNGRSDVGSVLGRPADRVGSELP